MKWFIAVLLTGSIAALCTTGCSSLPAASFSEQSEAAESTDSVKINIIGAELTQDQEKALEKSDEFQKSVSTLLMNYVNQEIQWEEYSGQMEEWREKQQENILTGLDAVTITEQEREEILPVLETALENFLAAINDTAASLRKIADEEGSASTIAVFSGKLSNIFSAVKDLTGTVGNFAEDRHTDEKAIKELEEKYSAQIPSDYLRSLVYGQSQTENAMLQSTPSEH